MGKSIRSKQKRKHRTEFRNTHGTVAYNKQQSQIQEKLTTCIQKQSTSMEGLSRLSKQLGNSDLPEPQDFEERRGENHQSDAMDDGVVDALETTTALVSGETTPAKGENKVPKRKSRRGRKYNSMLKAKGTSKQKDSKDKPKPKYFCQF